MSNAPLIYLIAGEPSGDLLGGRLMQALVEQTQGNIRFAGIGGETMSALGLASLFPMSELSVMGLVEVLSHAPKLMRRINETVEHIVKTKPDVVVTIDAPDFCFRVARRVRQRDPSIKLVHYVAPSVWAWRPGRAAKIAGFFDHLLALLPFEPPYFEKAGLPCTFVGHPAVEETIRGDAARFRQNHSIAPQQTIISLLPGSRRSEIDRLLPLFIETARGLQTKHGTLFFALPTVSYLGEAVTELMTASGLPYAVVTGTENKADAFAASRVALAASGTVALELSLAALPSIIAYRVNFITAFLARRLVRLKHVSLPNLILNETIMPEYLQENATPNRLIPALEALLEESGERDRQSAAGARIAEILKPGNVRPSETAARVILKLLERARAK